MAERYRDVTEELKRNSAAMGMVFFGLKYGKPISDLDEYMKTGISVCDILIKGPALSKSGVPRYEDRAVKEAFIQVARRQGARHDPLSATEMAKNAEEMAKKAGVVKKTLKRLKDHERVSDEALDSSAEFFRSIYLAT